MKMDNRFLAALCASVLAAGTVRGVAMYTFPDGARVAFFGDSITANGGAMLRIAAHYREAFPNRHTHFYNCGISGGGLEAAEMYFGEILAARKPTHVVLAFGVNDSGAMLLDESAGDASAEARRVEEAAAAFRKRYIAMVGRIQALGAVVVLRTTTPYNESGGGSASPVKGRNAAYRRVADEIRAAARDLGLPLIDDYARMSELLAGGNNLFAADRVHPNDYGQWRMAETLLAAQGLKAAPYLPRAELAAKVGLSEWDGLWQRVADVNSCEWICVRDESLSLDAKIAKAKAWLEGEGAKSNANQYVVRIAKGYLRDKPCKDALIAKADAVWDGAPGVALAASESTVVEGSPKKMKWWTESRFGMFIHFGLYATPSRGEWVQSRETIEPNNYETYFEQFDPDLYNPGEWAKAAKAAGMKYVVLTAKHHEGFCLWDTKFTDYKVTNTPYGKDLLKPFVDAFRAEGLRVGFYYSLLDWHHPDYAIDVNHPLHPKDDAEWNDPKAYIPLNAGRDMAKYRQYMKDQVRELLTDFGRIDIMWFDYSYPKHHATPKGRDDWDSEGLLKLARSIQPWLIVDDRLDLDDEAWGWDFRTPEQFRMPVWPTKDGKRVPWETCQTFSGAWGYSRDEMTWKSSAQLLELLANTVSKGGNLILNVGPTARGEFDARAKDRLAAMGRWMRVNGRSIYGCTAAPEEFAPPEYSLLTYNPVTRRLYVHLVFYPMGSLACSFADKVKWARFLHDGSEVQIRPLNKNLTAAYPEVPKHNFILPVVKPDVEMPVIEVQLKDDDAPFDMPPIPMPQFADRDFSITDFGAKEGIKATGAFAAAMAECEKSGGGRVVVPKGKWLTGAVHFRSNCNLYLDEGATLEFTDDPADYLPVVHTTWEGVECMNLSPLLYAYGVTNVAITGKGLIAPRMNFWRTWFTRPPEHMYATECLYYWCSTNAPMFARDVTAIKGSNVRPHLIQFNRCKGVLLDGFRIRESPFWMIHLYHSENCIVRNLDTYAHGHNNDGIDIEMTRNVLVENCRFDQGDDGIVLKAGRNQDAWRLNRPTENIVVRNCEFVFGHTLLGIGSELSGGIRNVWMHHCKIGSAFNLFYVKTNRRRGGFVKNIWFEDVESDNLKGALFRVETDVLYQWAKFPDYELRRTEIDGLHVRNVKANCADYAIDVRGDAAAPVRNVKLEDVWLGAFRKSFERIENAERIQKCNVRLGDLKPKPWVQPIVEVWHRKNRAR